MKYILAGAVLFLIPSIGMGADWTEQVFGNPSNCLPYGRQLYFEAQKGDFFTENLPVDVRKYLDPKKVKIAEQCPGPDYVQGTFETRGMFFGNAYHEVQIPVGDCGCPTCLLYIINFNDNAEQVRDRIFQNTGVMLKISPDEQTGDGFEPGLDENGNDSPAVVSGYLHRDGTKSSFVCDWSW